MILLLEWSVKMSVVLALALIVASAMRRKSAALRHWVLAAAVVCAALMPAVSLIVPAKSFPLADRAAAFVTKVLGEMRPATPGPEEVKKKVRAPEPPVENTAQNVPNTTNGKSNATEGKSGSPTQTSTGANAGTTSNAVSHSAWLNLESALMLAWIAGALAGCLALIVGTLRLSRLASPSHPPGEAWARIAEEISRDYGLRRRPRLFLTDRPTLLATWGMLRPMVLLPAGSAEWTEERIRVVLAHELAHIQRADWLTQIMAETVRAVFWFNPLLWIVCLRLRHESEQACDDAVLRRGVTAADYATHLLDLARALNGARRIWAAAIMMARASTLNSRFKAMLNPRADRGPVRWTPALALSALFLAVMVPVAAFQAATIGMPTVSPVPPAPPERRPVVEPQEPTRPPEPIEPEGPTVVLSPDGGTSIEGLVVRLGTKEAISGVEVELTRVEGTDSFPLKPGTPAVSNANGAAARILAEFLPKTPAAEEVRPHVRTDEDGRFTFKDLLPGQYRLVAAQNGGAYNPAEYGQVDPRGRGIAFPVARGQSIKNLKLEMAPTGAIAGKVTDEFGEPLGHASVFAYEVSYQPGRNTLNIVEAVHTDERGNYRLYWLPPGRYYVAAKVEDPRRREAPDYVPAPGAAASYQRASPPIVTSRVLPTGEVVDETYVPVYFGNALKRQSAAPVDLGPGMGFDGADISMGPGKVSAHRIQGVVVNNSGAPAANLSVVATRIDSTSDFLFISATTDASGAFSISGAPSGTYAVVAGDGVGIPAIVVSDSDVTGLRIQQPTAGGLSGRLVIEGRPPASADPDRARMIIRISKQNGGWVFPGPNASSDFGARISAEGQFNLPFGTRRGFYRIDVSGLPANMYVKSIRRGDADVLADGLSFTGEPQGTLDIVVGADAGAVNGVAVNAKLDGIANSIIALVPDPPSLRGRADLYRSATTGARGEFQLRAIPPGVYKLFAWDYAPEDAWLDKEFLQHYEPVGALVHINANGMIDNQRITVISNRTR